MSNSVVVLHWFTLTISVLTSIKVLFQTKLITCYSAITIFFGIDFVLASFVFVII
jgi:hypothetical protein